MNPNRRSFIKKTPLGLLSLSVVDLIPTAHAGFLDPNVPDPINKCVDASGRQSNPDAACSTGTPMAEDQHCGGQKFSNKLFADEDQNCGVGDMSKADQDQSCDIAIDNTNLNSTDNACDSGFVMGGQENDEACSMTNRDQSCVPFAHENKHNKDESCGSGGSMPYADQHCNVNDPNFPDPDNTQSYVS